MRSIFLSMNFFDLGLYTLPLQFFLGHSSILHHLAQTPSGRIIRVLRAEFRLRHASCFVRRQPFGHSLGGGALAVEAEHEDHENFLEAIFVWIRTADPVCLLFEAMQCYVFGSLTFDSRVFVWFLQNERIANNRIAKLYALAAFAFAFMGFVSSVIFLIDRPKLLADRKRTQWLRVCEFYIN